MLLWLFLALAAGQQLEFAPLASAGHWRVDVPAEQVLTATICYSMHAPEATATCSSPGFFRRSLVAGQTLLITPLHGADDCFALVEVETETGERLVQALPPKKAKAAESGGSSVPVDGTPWYYYTIVGVACCIIGGVVLVVVLGVWHGKQYPFSASFLDAYQSRKNARSRIVGETLGLYHTMNGSLLDDAE
jgi:hypothetical protein